MGHSQPSHWEKFKTSVGVPLNRCSLSITALDTGPQLIHTPLPGAVPPPPFVSSQLRAPEIAEQGWITIAVPHSEILSRGNFGVALRAAAPAQGQSLMANDLPIPVVTPPGSPCSTCIHCWVQLGHTARRTF